MKIINFIVLFQSREQMHREIKARREFQAKWSFMASKNTNKFYDQSHLNSKVAEVVSKGLSNSRKINLIIILRFFKKRM